MELLLCAFCIVTQNKWFEVFSKGSRIGIVVVAVTVL